MPEPGFDVLERELVELGRSIVTAPPPDDLVSAVLARIDVGPDPASDPTGGAVLDGSSPTGSSGRRWLHGRRLGWAIAAATVLLLALIPPVRAAVLELLRIGGVVVREEPAPRGLPTTAPAATVAPEPGATAATLAEAERAVGSHIAVPASLGPPSQVAVARGGRLAELTWVRDGRTTRLDVFAGSLSWGYLKTVWNAMTPTLVNGNEAVWFGSPHLIEWVDRTGTTHRDQPRLAGPTLVWVVPGESAEVTYRLEGPRTLAEAVEIAQSAR
ncbi:hypothetical protein ACWEOW_08550 [Monashia sp. NPDC004114]